MMPLSYRPDEVTLPVGHTVDHLDWVGFSWDLYRKGSSKRSQNGRFYQVIVVPGRLIIRHGTFRKTTGVWAAPVGTIQSLPPDERGVMPLAMDRTGMILSQHYQWVCAPFAVDFATAPLSWDTTTSLKEKYGSSEIRTLGDLMAPGDYGTTPRKLESDSDFFSTLFRHRASLQFEKARDAGLDPDVWEGF